MDHHRTAMDGCADHDRPDQHHRRQRLRGGLNLADSVSNRSKEGGLQMQVVERVPERPSSGNTARARQALSALRISSIVSRALDAGSARATFGEAAAARISPWA